ncbi:MAG: Gfo/Idh/MocA family protein [Gemmatimonadaceae bacterium]
MNVLFLGCGWATSMHSRTLRKIGGIRLFYASRDAGRAERYRLKFGGQRAFGSYDDAVAEPSVDVAVVATPTSAHRDLTLLALNAGRHVIVEKPAFMRASDVDPVRDAARRSGKQVLVAENYFYKPITAHLRSLVRDGRFGDVRFVSVNATKRQTFEGWRERPEVSGGGALFEGGVHWVSFMASLGLDVAGVRAYRVGTTGGMDVSTLSVFEYSNGAVGTLAHSWELGAPFGGMRVSKIQGTRGAITFESNGLAYLGTDAARSFGLPVIGGDFLGYRAMFRDFLDAIRTGRPAQFTLDLAERDLRLLEQAVADWRVRSAEIRS